MAFTIRRDLEGAEPRYGKYWGSTREVFGMCSGCVRVLPVGGRKQVCHSPGAETINLQAKKISYEQHIHRSLLMFCRGDRTRTCDSLVPNQERYQLRYTSLLYLSGCKGTNNLADKRLKAEESFIF